MLESDRLVRPCWIAAVLLVVVGVALTVAGTLGLAGAEPTTIVGGILALGAAIVAAALARYLAGSVAGATAIGVMGFMVVHLLAAVVTIFVAAVVILYGANRQVALVWGVTAAVALAISYGWDRATESDVDAALEADAWNPRS